MYETWKDLEVANPGLSLYFCVEYADMSRRYFVDRFVAESEIGTFIIICR